MSPLLHTTKEILAAAFLEVFPGTQLLGGSASETLFFYDFLPPEKRIKTFGASELERIEDQMRLIIVDRRPISELEMVPASASGLFSHHGQEELAIELESEEASLVSIFKMGTFYDLCPSPYLPDSGAISAFKLLDAKWDGEVLHVVGTAAANKQDLKEFLKRYKEAKQNDPIERGNKLSLFTTLSELEDLFVFLPKGEPLRHSLTEKWREMHTAMGFKFAYSSQPVDFFRVHDLIFKREKPPLPYKVATLHEDEDWASIFCEEKDLLSELISSLHFIEQTIKIFQLETRVYLVRPKRGAKKEFTLLKDALVTTGIAFEEEMSDNVVSIDFRLLDGYGNSGDGATLTCDIFKGSIYRSLFGSIDRWVTLMVGKLS